MASGDPEDTGTEIALPTNESPHPFARGIHSTRIGRVYEVRVQTVAGLNFCDEKEIFPKDRFSNVWSRKSVPFIEFDSLPKSTPHLWKFSGDLYSNLIRL